jgi:hypothetical protein
MSDDISSMLQSVYHAVTQLRASATLHDLDLLQGVIRNTVSSTTPAFEPAYAAATALLVSVRNQYVEDLSDADFLALVKNLAPEMLEVTMVGDENEDDCDDDGELIVDGEEVAPAIDAQSIDSAARRKFVIKAGFRFCDDATSPPKISPAQIDALGVAITDVALDNEEELSAAWLASVESYRKSSAPIRMAMPR